MEVLKYLGPFIGVFLGWILSRISDIDKNKRSDNKRLKRIIFLMLEIRFQLLLPKRANKTYEVFIYKLKLVADDLNENPIYYDKLHTMFQNLVITQYDRNYDVNLIEQFNKCIDDLSEIDPVLSYLLNGKQNTIEYIETWSKEFKNILQSDNPKEIENTINEFKPVLIEELLEDYDNLLIKVSARLNRKTQSNIKNTLKFQFENVDDNKIESIIKKVISGS